MIHATGPSKGLIQLKCEDCKRVRVVRRNTALLERKEHPCRSCSNKRNGIAKAGKYSSWNSGMKKPQSERNLGGQYENHSGYMEMWVGLDSEKYGRKDGYVLIHRKVAQDSIGRPLSSREVVHHVDGNKKNNSPENLFVCESASHHRELHNNLEEVAFMLFQKGIIIFNEGKYDIAPHNGDIVLEPGEFRGRLRLNSYGNPEPRSE